MRRIERDGLLERGNGFSQPAPRLEDDAEVAVPVCLARREREALLDQRERVVAAALLMRDDARVVHRVRLVGRLLEDRPIDVLGGREVTVLLAADRDRHRLRDGDFTRYVW